MAVCSTDLAAALVAGLAAGAGGEAGVLAPPPQRVQQPLLPGHQPVQVQTRSVASISILQFAKSEIIQD